MHTFVYVTLISSVDLDALFQVLLPLLHLSCIRKEHVDLGPSVGVHASCNMSCIATTYRQADRQAML